MCGSEMPLVYCCIGAEKMALILKENRGGVERLAVYLDRGIFFLDALYADDGDFANKFFPRSYDQNLSLHIMKGRSGNSDPHVCYVRVKSPRNN